MVVKLKICGVSNVEDAVAIDSIDGVDYIGMVNDPVSPRFAPIEELLKAVRIVKKPLVAVKVYGDIKDIISMPTPLIQIHRVLNDAELEELTTVNSSRVILYVPASLEYLSYLRKAQRHTGYILIDSPRKGSRVDVKIVREMLDYHPDAGVAGGINLENIYEFLSLNPGWIDVSSSVEQYPGKKDLSKVRRLAEVVKSAR